MTQGLEFLGILSDTPPHGERSCFACKHLQKEYEDWEHSDYWWFECVADHTRENLKGFPWRVNTKCKLFETVVVTSTR